MAQWRSDAPSRLRTMKQMRITPNHRAIDLAVAKAPPTDLEAGSAERARLYHTARWLRARHAFLVAHPLCITCEQAGFIVAAVAVDHRDGHRRTDWRGRFWDQTRWQSLCAACHNQKSAKELADWNASASAIDIQP